MKSNQLKSPFRSPPACRRTGRSALHCRRQLVSYGPTRPEIVGLNWVRQGAQWDIARKHGDLASCIQKGQEAGHIQAPSKRSWAQCEAASSSPMSMPDDRKHASD